MPDGFCEPEDVRQALQERELSGSTSASMIKPAIHGLSEWFARRTNGWWYDSSGTSGDVVPTAPVSADAVRLDVPSSPHRQDRQLFHDEHGARYPVTTNGPYARIPLPHRHVQSVTSLAVRDRGGDTNDWVAASDKVGGRGEDYYVDQPGQESYGRSYLYIRASSIGPRVDYGGLLTLAYDYGLDDATESWADVREGIAYLAAADVVDEDGVLTQIPENARLAGVQTQHQNLVDTGEKLLGPYLTAEVR